LIADVIFEQNVVEMELALLGLPGIQRTVGNGAPRRLPADALRLRTERALRFATISPRAFGVRTPGEETSLQYVPR